MNNMSEEKHEHKQVTISEKIATKIAECGDEVERQVVEALASKEVTRRTSIITEAVGYIANQEKAFKKLDQPDGKVYIGLERTPQITYTDKRIKDIQKGKEDLEKLHKAFNKALNNNKAEDYDELQKLLKPAAAGGDKSPAAE